MATLRLFTLFVLLASVYSKVLVGKSLCSINKFTYLKYNIIYGRFVITYFATVFIPIYTTDREVTEEDDPLEYNIENGGGNYQGDMKFTEEDLALMESNEKSRALKRSNRPKSGSFVNIPYVIDENHSYSERGLQNIKGAMAQYAEKTCIRYYVYSPEFLLR